MERQYDLVIIGAGPAGMSAALYGSRAGLKTVMIESGAPGGKLLKTHKIANYPGTGEVNGADLAAKMLEQATAFGAAYEYGEVTDISKDRTVTLADGTVIQAKAIIVATGTREKMMGIPGEAQNVGHGVSFCAVCDGAFFRGKDVAVIGSGNTALEETEFLTQFADHIYIVTQEKEVTADEGLQGVLHDEKVKLILHHRPKEVLSADHKVAGLVIEDTETGDLHTLDVKGIFPYEGQNPMSSALVNLGILDTNGFVRVNEQRMTSVPGIYAAGDIVAKDLRQIATAVSDGAVAAQDASKKIRQKRL
ncbi:NAD(P)/FAD-dependent oxidoreductase [Catenisphaera adipataccumulans]|jgi:thioredoxin reductase (NADPH)|uniref:Thioredoxin reductase (NADPH) n=1 Tax=Catenisphaera adipataccumulans TaxID=700500 RepID=A0A7W8CVN6_9FIRM|nr:FAD-dependent oxidoreductase [Catenisphaera adipataccumulans]MBB5182466.1 thioredoxin reductase (NADPH) [Catenisphaera adipataccumulans]